MSKILNIIILAVILTVSNKVYAFENLEYATKSENSTQTTNKEIKEIYKFSKLKFSEEGLPVKPNQKKLKENRKEKKKKIAAAQPGLTLIWSGIIIWAIGLLVIIFLSILFGALLCILGIVLWVLGGVKFNKAKLNGETKPSRLWDSDQSSSTYKDVVYLKNGSVIKGIIIEQIPNISLKIESADGSIFVYKMEEVEKIGKEKSK